MERKKFMINWFQEIRTLEDLRKHYKKLLKEHHPDNGGTDNATKEINTQYDALYDSLSRQKFNSPTSIAKENDMQDKAFRTVFEQIIHINADIEIIGSWIWIFNGYTNKDLLKSCGFKWAPKHKAWIWHFDAYYRFHNGNVSLGEIRRKYGSESIRNYEKQHLIN